MIDEATGAILARDPILDYGDAGLMCYWCGESFEDFTQGHDADNHHDDCVWAVIRKRNPKILPGFQ